MSPTSKVTHVEVVIRTTTVDGEGPPVVHESAIQFEPDQFRVESNRDITRVYDGDRVMAMAPHKTYTTISGAQISPGTESVELLGLREPPSGHRDRVHAEMTQEAMANIKDIHPSDPVEERAINDASVWLGIATAARAEGHTVTPCDDPMRRVMGFIVEERGIWFYISLTRLKNSLGPVPEESRKLLSTPEGRYELLVGHPQEQDEPTSDLAPLEAVWMAEAEESRPLDMGDIPLVRPQLG